MGWTYTIQTKSGLPLMDDQTFDREYLGKFMNLSEKQWKEDEETGQCEITLKEINRAIKFLDDFNERIRKMPFDETEGRSVFKNVRVDKKTGKVVRDESGEYVYDYYGSEKNVAILKEVEKVLARDYHFCYPWDKDGIMSYGGFGVQYMINALKEVKKQMLELNIKKVDLLSY